jgi:hypothetical protein
MKFAVGTASADDFEEAAPRAARLAMLALLLDALVPIHVSFDLVDAVDASHADKCVMNILRRTKAPTRVLEPVTPGVSGLRRLLIPSPRSHRPSTLVAVPPQSDPGRHPERADRTCCCKRPW